MHKFLVYIRSMEMPQIPCLILVNYSNIYSFLCIWRIEDQILSSRIGGRVIINDVKQFVIQFVKPNWIKIVTMLAATALSYFYVRDLLPPDIFTADLPRIGRGLPFAYVIEGCTFAECGHWFRSNYLIIDLIIWYFIPCIVISIYKYVRNELPHRQPLV